MVAISGISIEKSVDVTLFNPKPQTLNRDYRGELAGACQGSEDSAGRMLEIQVSADVELPRLLLESWV